LQPSLANPQNTFLTILTACSRRQNYAAMLQSIEQSKHNVDPKLGRLDYLWRIRYQKDNQPDPYGTVKDNELLDATYAGWIWILDDDNLCHPDFFEVLLSKIINYPQAEAFVFAQDRGPKFGGLLRCGPENMIPGRVDTAQVVFKKEFLGDLRFPIGVYVADGILYQQLYAKDPKKFEFFNIPVTYFNRLRWDDKRV